MKSNLVIPTSISLYLLLLCFVTSCTNQNEIYIETESFDEKGGWKVDVQSSDVLGSPYLIAHGLGRPVKDASTTIELPGTGKWNLYVKTYNWTSPWSDKKGPGGFKILINDKQIGQDDLGTSLKKWDWEYVGEFEAPDKEIKISLHDLTGFDGRADAIFICREKDRSTPRTPVKKISKKEKYDLIVVGGGISGICASVAAARLGVKVALVNDYRILGGNNSSLIRVHLGGKICLDPYPKLGEMIKEFGHKRFGNAMPEENYEDYRKDSIIEAEENITLYTPYHFTEAKTKDNRIKSIIIRHNETGERIELRAPIFADCTGDASLGVAAGADYRYGRESRDDFQEASAPSVSDSLIMGGSIQWYSEESSDTSFPVFDYGLNITDSSAHAIKKGDWMWETGMNRDMINETERIRDYGMLVAYSNWSYVKNQMGLFSDRELKWVSYILGKRESRRLMGEFVLKEQDIMNHVEYEDASATTTWSIDLHYPDTENTKYFPGNEFLTTCVQNHIKPYAIPYRCFYSRNIKNLFMAGRDISVTHIALGTTRVMRTCGMMGEVVGMAASICKEEKCLPKDIYSIYLDDLKELMTEGVGHINENCNNQAFNGF